MAENERLNDKMADALKKEMHIKDDVVVIMLCEGCGTIMCGDPKDVRTCRTCHGMTMKPLKTELRDGKIVFRKG